MYMDIIDQCPINEIICTSLNLFVTSNNAKVFNEKKKILRKRHTSRQFLHRQCLCELNIY